MGIYIGDCAVWRTAKEARQLGATHYGWAWRIVPGFLSTDGVLLWVPRSDLLNWVEDALNAISALAAMTLGIEPKFGFLVGDEIKLGNDGA